MAFFFLKPSANCLKVALFASAILLISAQGHTEPGSEGPFLGLSGARADQLPLKLGKPTHDCTEEGDALSCSMDR
jgi:hypothetical protein